MRKKISVIGEGVKVGQDLARNVDVSDDPRGADVVVLAGEADLAAVRERAPAAVVLVAGDDLERRCQEAYEATLFPRARIIGVASPAGAAESIVFERGDEHEVVAMADGAFGRRAARLGRGGIRELL
jgi:hypothetical protein